MENVLSFAMNYYQYLIPLIVCLVGATVFGRKKTMAIAYGILMQYKDVIIHMAENQHETCSKFIYDNIPIYLKMFLTQKMIDAVVTDFLKILETSTQPENQNIDNSNK